MSTRARWIPRRTLLPEPRPRRLRCRHRPSAFTEVHLRMQTPPCSCSYHAKQNSIQTDKRNLEGEKKIKKIKRWMFHSSFHLEGAAIRSHAIYSKGKKIYIYFFFSKCASLFLICLHFLYCIYRICNFHQGKTNHSLTTFFQKCWETDEYIVLTHLLNTNSGRAGQTHKLFLCPVFKHVLALTDMGRALPPSLKKYRLKSCQRHSNSPDTWTSESWEGQQHLPKLRLISERFQGRNNDWAAASEEKKTTKNPGFL